jgi:hypothetical protein
VIALAQRAGLQDLARGHVRINRPCGVNAEVKIGCLVAGMTGGSDLIDDMDVRQRAMPDVAGGIRAPSILGSHLRPYRCGNVRQLTQVHRELLAELAAGRRCCPARMCSPPSISTRCKRVCGHIKQGAAFGHTKTQGKSLFVRGLNALAAVTCTPLTALVIAATGLRGGTRTPPAVPLASQLKPSARRGRWDAPCPAVVRWRSKLLLSAAFVDRVTRSTGRGFAIMETRKIRPLTCNSVEPPIGIEPMTYALRGAAPSLPKRDLHI